MEDDGLVMFESEAMVDYILDRYGEGDSGHCRVVTKTPFTAVVLVRRGNLARPIGDVPNIRM